MAAAITTFADQYLEYFEVKLVEPFTGVLMDNLPDWKRCKVLDVGEQGYADVRKYLTVFDEELDVNHVKMYELKDTSEYHLYIKDIFESFDFEFDLKIKLCYFDRGVGMFIVSIIIDGEENNPIYLRSIISLLRRWFYTHTSDAEFRTFFINDIKKKILKYEDQYFAIHERPYLFCKDREDQPPFSSGRQPVFPSPSPLLISIMSTAKAPS